MNRQSNIKIPKNSDHILALDVGDKRIGLAIGNTLTRLPRPLATISNDASVWDTIAAYIRQEEVTALVVGLPRNLDGEDTPQTATVRVFATDLGERFGLPIHLQDEALTSRHAEAELDARGGTYKRSDIDSLAATLILSDYLNEVQINGHAKT